MKPIMICWRSTPMGHDVTNNILLFPSSFWVTLQCDGRVDIKVVATHWQFTAFNKWRFTFLLSQIWIPVSLKSDSWVTPFVAIYIAYSISLSVTYILTPSNRLTAAVTLQLGSTHSSSLQPSHTHTTSERCAVKCFSVLSLSQNPVFTFLHRIQNQRSAASVCLCERSETR